VNQILIKVAWGKSIEHVHWRGKNMTGKPKEAPEMLEDVRALRGIVDDDKKGNQTIKKRNSDTGN
jgi:uncharacterized protein YmfQ (DUF2313 family)